MDESTGNICPRCGALELTIYFTEDTGLETGAHCAACEFKGFYSSGKLLQLA
jgi:hypothetical protein